METKQLSLRLAGEQFGIHKATVYWHISKKYTKLEQVDLVSVQCLGKNREALYGLFSYFVSLA